MNRFQFVADHQRRYGVKRLCTTSSSPDDRERTLVNWHVVDHYGTSLRRLPSRSVATPTRVIEFRRSDSRQLSDPAFGKRGFNSSG
ncbi:hypothetical protein [Streptomyces flaveolus]|uniref:Uncharacterized protein n=1 Tax=Streptomyces flaveolus TaxID=67297 RepID=A0ABV3AQ59_9ACTN